MANGLSEDSGGVEKRARNWENPDGLGWEVWRRAGSTGLLSQRIQREVARFRRDVLRDPVPLASEIQRRWGSGGNIARAGFGMLPLFWGRVPFSHANRGHRLSASGPVGARPFANSSPVSRAYAVARLPEAATGSAEPPVDIRTLAPAPRSGDGSGAHVVSPIATRAGPARTPASLDQGPRGRARSRVALSSILARRILRPWATLTTAQAVPLSRGTTSISGAIDGPHAWMTVSLQRGGFNPSRTEGRSRSAPGHPGYDASAPLIASIRGGGLRTGAQSSLGAEAEPLGYDPGRVPSGDVPRADLPGASGRRDISGAAFAEPRVATATTGGAASGGVILQSPASRRSVGVGQAPVAVTDSGGDEQQGSAPLGQGTSARKLLSFAREVTGSQWTRWLQSRSSVGVGQAPVAVTDSGRDERQGSAPLGQGTSARKLLSFAREVTGSQWTRWLQSRSSVGVGQAPVAVTGSGRDERQGSAPLGQGTSAKRLLAFAREVTGSQWTRWLQSRSSVGVGQAPVAVTGSGRDERQGSAPLGEGMPATRSLLSLAKGVAISQMARVASGVAGPTFPLPAKMVGGILRSLRIRPPAGAAPGPPIVTGPPNAQVSVPLPLPSTRSLGAPGAIHGLNTVTSGPGPAFGPAARPLQMSVGIGASSRGAEGSLDRGTIGSEPPRSEVAPVDRQSAVDNLPSSGTQQPQRMPSPLVKAQSEPGGHRIAASFDAATGAQSSDVAIGAASVEARGIAGRETIGESQPQTTAPPILVVRADEVQRKPDPSTHLRFVRRGALGVAARTRAIVSGLAPIPLSIARVFRRGHPMAGKKEERIVPEGAVPATPLESTSLARVQSGRESRVGIRMFPGIGSRAFRARAASDGIVAFGPLLGRAPAETVRDPVDSPRLGDMRAPAPAPDGETLATSVNDPLREDSSIFRAAAPGRLPLVHGGLPSESADRARESAAASAGRLAVPLVVARSALIRTGLGDRWPDITAVSTRWNSAVTRAMSSGMRSRPGLAPVLGPMRWFDAPVREQYQAAVPALRSTLDDLPLATLSAPRDEGSRTVVHRTPASALQSAPQDAASAPNRALAIAAGADIRAAGSPTSASRPPIDLDELIEKAWPKLMRKFTIEQERRGYTRWL